MRMHMRPDGALVVPATTRTIDEEFDLTREGVLIKQEETDPPSSSCYQCLLHCHVVRLSVQVQRFVQDCVARAGATFSHGEQLARVLVEADLRARYCHGLNRLAMYVNELRALVCQSEGEPCLINDRQSTAWVDGRHLLGPVVGNFAMRIAIEKAKQTGFGVASCFNSNHFGIAGSYTKLAADQQLIGVCMSNTSPLCFPTRSSKIALGTNALAVCAPGLNGDNFDLDMATTSVPIGRIELAQMKGERHMPITWGADSHGIMTDNPDDVLEGGGLLPLGGPEFTGGYKGYGLALMVEMLCGVLAGAQWGPHIRRWRDYRQSANLGQTFIALDPACFAPGFESRLQVVLDTMRKLKPTDRSRPVQVPGDPEHRHKKLCAQLGGIPYHPNQIDHAHHIAAQLGVTPIVTKPPPRTIRTDID